MKKRKLFILLIILIFINFFFNLYFEYKENIIISKAIYDTKATFDTTSISINVDANAPDVFIIHPQNTTYRTNISLPLNYSVSDRVSDINTIWYNLDRGNNISLIGNTTFNTSEGSHTLYLFANDTKGYLNNSESVTFFINTSLGYNITYTEFTGQTTNFNSLANSQQANISNVILHVPNYGKITFNENISIISDINLDNNIEIGDNSIVLNSNNLPNFNKSATLQLYNLTFNNPKIQIDDNDCSSAICLINSYSNGILNFNVTHFTKYSAAESTSPSAPGGGTSGGGSGGSSAEVVKEVENFEVEPEILKVSLKQGETKKESIKIKNIGDEKLDISISLEELKEFVAFPTGLSTQNFELQPGEEKLIQLIFSIEKDQIPDLYVKDLIITTDSKKKIVKIVIEVESLSPIFDIKVEIPQEFLEIAPGKDLLAQVSIFNIKGVGIVDVHVIYTVKDMEGNIILEEDEYLAVETRTTFIKRLRMPSNLEEGNYILYLKVKYDDTIGSSNALFSVSKKYIETPLKRLELYTALILFIIIIFIVMLYFEYKRAKQLKRLIKGVTEKDLRDKGLIKRR